MIYVALLRGINVGGKSRVEMPRLQALFEDLGCTNVRTYINSGNVIFVDSRSTGVLIPLIESAIENEFGFLVSTIIRDAENIKQLCAKIPSDWVNDVEQKTDVIFLWKEVDGADILKRTVIKPEIENVMYADGALVWNIGRKNVTRGGAIKLIKTADYKYMTIRNINTVRKLNQHMSEVSPATN